MSRSSLTLIFFLTVLLLLPAAGLASHKQKKRVSAFRRSNMAQIQEQPKKKSFNKKARHKTKKAGNYQPKSSQQELVSVRQEISQLQAGKKSGRMKFGIGPDHYARLKAKLDSLAKAGAAATDIKILEEMLLTLAPWSPNTPLSTEAAGPHQKLKELQSEIAGFSPKSTPTKEHYHRIMKDLIYLEQQAVPAEEIAALRQALAPFDPLAIKEQDREQAVMQSQPPPPTCVSNPSPVFTHDITDLTRISQINAPVMLQNSGAVKSHSYVWIAGGGSVPVYAPIDSQLVSGVYASFPAQGTKDYGLIFRVSCEVGYRFGHFTDPLPHIRALFPGEPKINDSRDDPITPIPVKAGELLGYTDGTPQAHNFDFGVYNDSRLNSLSLDQPGVSQKDITANCPYDYYPPEKKAEYYARFQSPPNSSVLLQLCRSY